MKDTCELTLADGRIIQADESEELQVLSGSRSYRWSITNTNARSVRAGQWILLEGDWHKVVMARLMNVTPLAPTTNKKVAKKRR